MTAVRVRHFSAEEGEELATMIQAWLQHPDREFVSLSYGSASSMNRALLVYRQSEPVSRPPLAEAALA